MRGCGHTFVRLGFVLTSLVMAPGVSRAAPIRCDLAIQVTPPNLPAGARTARIRIPTGIADLQLRASSGTSGSPVSFGAGTVEAEFQAGADSPPIVIVAAVGPNACGFSVIHVAAPRETASSPLPVTLTLVEPGTASADQDADVLVYVFATDERGNPRRGSAPAIQPSVGSVARVESLGPGAWRARWRVPPGEAKAAAVTAAFGLEPSAAASLARKPGTPQAIEITQDAGSVAGAGLKTSVVVRIRDSAATSRTRRSSWSRTSRNSTRRSAWSGASTRSRSPFPRERGTPRFCSPPGPTARWPPRALRSRPRLRPRSG